IFFSPSEVFRNLRRHPRWLVALLLMTVLSATYTNLFISHIGAERIANYGTDKALEISFLGDDQRKAIEANRQKSIDDLKNPVIRAGQAVSSFSARVLWFSFLAAVFFVFALAMGGKVNYWQAFSAAVYASFAVNVI